MQIIMSMSLLNFAGVVGLCEITFKGFGSAREHSRIGIQLISLANVRKIILH